MSQLGKQPINIATGADALLTRGRFLLKDQRGAFHGLAKE